MSFDNQPDKLPLKVPEGIHYGCTGCGKCCSGWSVPLTEEDYQRIVDIDWGSLSPELKNKKLFRPLKQAEKINTPYAYAINAEPDGQCPFLKDNLCFIHSQFGAQTKPSICQLFPYSFNETPDGVYSTVSFISRGAIFNAGHALSEQKDYLQGKYNDFKRLFPDHHPNWSQIKLSSNVPLTWPEYLETEKNLLAHWQDQSKNLESRFLDGSAYLNVLLAEKTGKQLSPPVSREGTLNAWDKILIATLYRTYFPRQTYRVKGYGKQNLHSGSFLTTMVSALFSNDIFGESSKLPWPENDQQINDLIYRFVYSHIFAKLYFGAGFGQLSLIAGFHHLALGLVLIKLKARALAGARKPGSITMADVVTAVVQLEKGLGEVKISPYGAATLELLLASESRLRRCFAFGTG